MGRYIWAFCVAITGYLNGLNAQDSLPSYVHYYQFGSAFYDLNSLEKVAKIDYPAQGWKYASRYASRYQRLAIDKLAFRGKLFEILPNNGLRMTDMLTQGSLALPNKESSSERDGQNFMITCADGVLYVKHLSKDLGFRVYKYDAMGSEVFGVAIPHSDIVQREKYQFHRPYLRYFAHTPQQIAFTSYERDVAKTVLLDTKNGTTTDLDFSIQGVIRDADEQRFVGYIGAGNPLRIRLDDADFSVPMEQIAPINSIEAILHQGVLYCALYDSKRAGCLLWALDVASRQWLWKTTIAEMPAEQTSYYYNNIWLSLYQDKLLLEGLEMNGKYFAVVNSKTGKVIFNVKG